MHGAVHPSHGAVLEEKDKGFLIVILTIHKICLPRNHTLCVRWGYIPVALLWRNRLIFYFALTPELFLWFIATHSVDAQALSPI